MGKLPGSPRVHWCGNSFSNINVRSNYKLN